MSTELQQIQKKLDEISLKQQALNQDEIYSELVQDLKYYEQQEAAFLRKVVNDLNLQINLNKNSPKSIELTNFRNKKVEDYINKGKQIRKDLEIRDGQIRSQLKLLEDERNNLLYQIEVIRNPNLKPTVSQTSLWTNRSSQGMNMLPNIQSQIEIIKRFTTMSQADQINLFRTMDQSSKQMLFNSIVDPQLKTRLMPFLKEKYEYIGVL